MEQSPVKNTSPSEFDAGVRVLAAVGFRVASPRSSQGCPELDTAGCSWLQWPHRRAQLSPTAPG